jgi:hypothetical protein
MFTLFAGGFGLKRLQHLNRFATQVESLEETIPVEEDLKTRKDEMQISQ